MGALKKFTKDWWKEDDKKLNTYFKKSKIAFHEMRITSIDEIPDLVSPKQAALKLGYHYMTIMDLKKSKKIRFEKRGGRYYTTAEWIADYLQSESMRK